LIFVVLLNSNFGAGDGAAAEGADFALRIGNDAVAGGVDSEVAADTGANTSTLAHTNLADDNLACLNTLATGNFYAEALARTIMNVFGCTAGFDVTHLYLLPY
jgi:hypothetical protein